jgi:hypothetical protein
VATPLTGDWRFRLGLVLAGVGAAIGLVAALRR